MANFNEIQFYSDLKQIEIELLAETSHNNIRIILSHRVDWTESGVVHPLDMQQRDYIHIHNIIDSHVVDQWTSKLSICKYRLWFPVLHVFSGYNVVVGRPWWCAERNCVWYLSWTGMECWQYHQHYNIMIMQPCSPSCCTTCSSCSSCSSLVFLLQALISLTLNM